MFIEMIKLNMFALISNFLRNQFHPFHKIDLSYLDSEALLDTFFALRDMFFVQIYKLKQQILGQLINVPMPPKPRFSGLRLARFFAIAHHTGIRERKTGTLTTFRFYCVTCLKKLSNFLFMHVLVH